jgi:hypothetical protein
MKRPRPCVNRGQRSRTGLALSVQAPSPDAGDDHFSKCFLASSTAGSGGYGPSREVCVAGGHRPRHPSCPSPFTSPCPNDISVMRVARNTEFWPASRQPAYFLELRQAEDPAELRGPYGGGGIRTPEGPKAPNGGRASLAIEPEFWRCSVSICHLARATGRV